MWAVAFERFAQRLSTGVPCIAGVNESHENFVSIKACLGVVIVEPLGVRNGIPTPCHQSGQPIEVCSR